MLIKKKTRFNSELYLLSIIINFIACDKPTHNCDKLDNLIQSRFKNLLSNLIYIKQYIEESFVSVNHIAFQTSHDLHMLHRAFAINSIQFCLLFYFIYIISSIVLAKECILLFFIRRNITSTIKNVFSISTSKFFKFDAIKLLKMKTFP